MWSMAFLSASVHMSKIIMHIAWIHAPALGDGVVLLSWSVPGPLGNVHGQHNLLAQANPATRGLIVPFTTQPPHACSRPLP
jgi:hypothetical protein